MPPWLQELLNSRKGLEGPYAQNVSPVATPTNPSGVGTTAPTVSGGDFLDVFAKAMAQHLGTQDVNTTRQQQLQRDFLTGHSYAPGSEPQNPWAGPLTFQSAGDRLADMTNRTGAYAPINPGLAARQRNVRAQSRYVPTWQ